MTAVPKQHILPLPYLSASWSGAERDEQRFVAEVVAQLGGGDLQAIPVGRARMGLALLVKWAVREGRRTVLLSPCTIPDVVNMVRLAGGTPVFIDYAERSTHIDLDQLGAALHDQVACVLVTHYHVNQAEMPAIRALCENRDVPLFEDSALAFGGSIEGRPVGAGSTASVFSFSAFKTLNFFWGGLITTRDAALAEFLRAETAAWPRLSYSDYLKGAKSVSIYYLSTQPLVFTALTFPRLQRRARETSGPVELAFKRLEHAALDGTLATRPSLAAFAHWRRKLDSVAGQLQHRRRIAAIYRSRFGDRMVAADTSEAVLAGSCFVNFPLWVDAASRDDVHRRAMLAGFDLGRSLYPNVHALDSFRSCAGRSEEASRLVASTLYLPTHTGVTEAYAAALSDTVAELLSDATIAPKGSPVPAAVVPLPVRATPPDRVAASG